VVTVVYTANVHGQFERWGRPRHALGGFARRATLVRRLRADRAIVQVDAGGALLAAPGQLVYLDRDPAERLRRARFVLAAYRRLGVDALVPGSSDLVMGARVLLREARSAGVPFVAANLIDAGTRRPLFEPHRLVAASGFHVGIVGVVALSDAGEAELRADHVETTPAVEATTGAVAALRAQGADFIVALVHATTGTDAAARLAANLANVDLVVLGGTGSVTRQPLRAGRALVVEPGLDGKRVGRVDLALPEGGGTRTHRSREPRYVGHELTELSHEIGEDASVTRAVTAYVAGLRRRIDSGLVLSVDHRLANSTPSGAGRERGTGGRARPPLREDWSFASSSACQSCHSEETAQWKTTSHAFANDSLSTRGRQGDPECLPCHAIAFLRAGGTMSVATAMTYFPTVGCESCHGPSVAHVRTRDKTDTRRSTPEETCLECHSDERGGEDFSYGRDLEVVLGPGHGR
jgi:hypothetical protein